MQVNNRLFEIVYILIQKKKVTAKELANKFEVSTRTIYRDIETLSRANIPIYATKGKEGGIEILDDYVLNKMLLTEEESIREVVAFPMNSKAQDVLMNAPSEVDEKQLREVHIKVRD